MLKTSQTLYDRRFEDRRKGERRQIPDGHENRNRLDRRSQERRKGDRRES